MNERESQNLTFPISPQSVREYITAGGLPRWEQLPQNCRQELVQTLANLLAGLPELRALEVGHDRQS